MAWGPHVDPALYIAHCITTGLSFLGSLVMSFFCIKTGSFHTASGRLILAIALSDFLYSTANILAAFEGETVNTLCLTEGFLRVFSLELCLLFPTCIAILCYKATKAGQSFDQNAFVRKAIIYGTSGCLCLALGPLFLKDLSYANYDTICFTRFNPNANLVIRLILFFAYVGIPVFTALTISITGYLLVIRRVSRLPQSFIEGTGVSIYKLFWYPAVIFITYMPNIVMDIMKKIFVGVGDIFALKIITLVITHSFGFTNALVYGIQRKLYYGRTKDFDELENAEPILSRSGSCKSDTRELLKASQTW